MKRTISLFLAIVLFFTLAGCGSTAAQPTESPSEPEAPAPQVEIEPAFDLNAYKSAVDQCRKDIIDAYVYPGNMASYELDYLQIAQNISDDVEASEVAQSAL